MRREGYARYPEGDRGRDVPVRDQLINDVHDLQRAKHCRTCHMHSKGVSLTHTAFRFADNGHGASHLAIAAYHNKARRGMAGFLVPQ